MASKTKASSVAAPTNVEFEPSCEWQKEEGVDTLIIHLPDFKKEQLRVQVNNQGFLKISGTRPITEDGTRKISFLKEIKIPQGSDIYDIRAAFKNGSLHVALPKKVTTSPEHQQQQEQKPAPPPQPAPQTPEPEDTQKPEPDAPVPSNHEQKAPTSSAENGNVGTMTSEHEQPKDYLFGLKTSLAKLQVQKKVAVNFGIAIAVMVAVGAYVAYKCGADPSCSYVEESGLY